MTDFEQRRADVLNVRLLGAPAKAAAAWLSAIDKAERAGLPCPTWPELERIASSLPQPPDNLTFGARFTMADLHRAAEELAYLHAPVEARTSAAGLAELRKMFPPPIHAPTPWEALSGLKVIIDPTLPDRRLEFRDRDGNVTASFDL